MKPAVFVSDKRGITEYDIFLDTQWSSGSSFLWDCFLEKPNVTPRIKSLTLDEIDRAC